MYSIFIEINGQWELVQTNILTEQDAIDNITLLRTNNVENNYQAEYKDEFYSTILGI